MGVCQCLLRSEEGGVGRRDRFGEMIVVRQARVPRMRKRSAPLSMGTLEEWRVVASAPGLCEDCLSRFAWLEGESTLGEHACSID